MTRSAAAGSPRPIRAEVQVPPRPGPAGRPPAATSRSRTPESAVEAAALWTSMDGYAAHRCHRAWKTPPSPPPAFPTATTAATTTVSTTLQEPERRTLAQRFRTPTTGDHPRVATLRLLDAFKRNDWTVSAESGTARVDAWFQSARPVRGAIWLAACALDSSSVSIRAPRAERDLPAVSPAPASGRFNPRAPRGARSRPL